MILHPNSEEMRKKLQQKAKKGMTNYYLNKKKRMRDKLRRRGERNRTLFGCLFSVVSKTNLRSADSIRDIIRSQQNYSAISKLFCGQHKVLAKF